MKYTTVSLKISKEDKQKLTSFLKCFNLRNEVIVYYNLQDCLWWNNITELEVKKDKITRCRFCNSEAYNLGDKTSHLIPESLGNKTLITEYECPECNQKYSKIEGELKKFLEIPIIDCKIPSKEKYQKYFLDNYHIFELLTRTKSAVIILNKDGKIVEKKKLTIQTKEYNPIEVYLAFVKIMILSLKEENFIQNRTLIYLLESGDIRKARIKETIKDNFLFGNGLIVLKLNHRILDSKIHRKKIFSKFLVILKLGKYVYEVPIDSRKRHYIYQNEFFTTSNTSQYIELNQKINSERRKREIFLESDKIEKKYIFIRLNPIISRRICKSTLRAEYFKEEVSMLEIISIIANKNTLQLFKKAIEIIQKEQRSEKNGKKCN